MRNTLLAFTLLSAAPTFSATIEKVSFDANSRVISVDVSYGGGCKEHKFSIPPLAGCLESYPAQCQLKLVHTVVNGPDLCEAILYKTLTFNADDLGLDDSNWDNAFVEISSNDGSKGSFVNTRPDTDAPATSAVVCPAGSGRFVKFIPEFGEVQFLNADGSEWKSHHDGLSIVVLVLESNPAQIRATITDDEGNKIGSWRFTDGAGSFSVTYLAKTYTGCREE